MTRPLGHLTSRDGRGDVKRLARYSCLNSTGGLPTLAGVSDFRQLPIHSQGFAPYSRSAIVIHCFLRQPIRNVQSTERARRTWEPW